MRCRGDCGGGSFNEGKKKKGQKKTLDAGTFKTRGFREGVWIKRSRRNTHDAGKRRVFGGKRIAESTLPLVLELSGSKNRKRRLKPGNG